MPKKVSPENRVIRLTIGLPQRILDTLDDVVGEFNLMASKAGEPELSRSQFIAKSLTESYGDPAVVEFVKVQLGILQTKLDLNHKEKKGKK